MIMMVSFSVNCRMLSTTVTIRPYCDCLTSSKACTDLNSQWLMGRDSKEVMT